ncbi:MAG: hypothetical protein R2867_33395 [Caldilineaceae bacterium]
MANNTSSVGIAEPRPPRPTVKRRRWLRSDMVLAFPGDPAPDHCSGGLHLRRVYRLDLRHSTTDWKRPAPDHTFVGLKNWTRLINDRRFQMDLRNHLYAIGFTASMHDRLSHLPHPIRRLRGGSVLVRSLSFPLLSVGSSPV